jgi:hypothetical protein
MSVASPCAICGRANVEHTCDRCGRLVCGDHFDETLALCIECEGEVDGNGTGSIPDSEDMPDGVDTYRS